MLLLLARKTGRLYVVPRTKVRERVRAVAGRRHRGGCAIARMRLEVAEGVRFGSIEGYDYSFRRA